jgi:O-antigen/teichoic acid export membrane protein
MDFGITSAWGKVCTYLRSEKKPLLHNYSIWLKSQIGIALVGFILFLVIGSFFFEDDFIIYKYILCSLFISVINNFQKVTLSAFLEFKFVARLDLLESSIRSFTYLIVAFYYQTVVTLSLLSIVSALILLAFSSFFVGNVLRHLKDPTTETRSTVIYKGILNQAPLFLWLRLSTRAFHEVPILIIRYYSGEYVVGLLGSMRKLTEYLVIPFSIVGNIIMYRGKELLDSGKGLLLLNNINLLYFLALCSMPLIIVFQNVIGKSFVDSNFETNKFIFLTTLYTSSHIVFALYAPVSDYLGALLKRNIFLTIIVLIALISLGIIANMDLYYDVLIYLVVCLNVTLGIGYYIISRITILKQKTHFILKSEAMIIIQFLLSFSFLFQYAFEIGFEFNFLITGFTISCIFFWFIYRESIMEGLKRFQNI